MYSKQEASQLRQQFWTAFGQYMAPVLSVEGEKVNWINYKTGIKHFHFRMDAGSKAAWIGIELTQPDAEVQQWYFEELKRCNQIFQNYVKEDWRWVLHTTDDQGKVISRIYTELNGVSVFRKEDWPALISFFKPRTMALDAFWHVVKYNFEML